MALMYPFLALNCPSEHGANTTVKYLDIPLALKYSLGAPDGVQFFAMAGPSLGYAISGELETFAKVLIDVRVASTPIDLSAQNYKRFEVGGIVGLGVSAPLGNGRVFLDGRYTTSFMDVYEVPVVGANVRNQGYGVSLGYIMNL
ncbi:MAG: PorT family protein [Saprospiraceae bacterium]|nr:PorT family protein [Saprospiraceae bacterium]